MSEPHLPLSYLQSQLDQFQLLLPALVECVNHVMSEECHGCQILSYLHDQCSSGIPIIQSSFERSVLTAATINVMTVSTCKFIRILCVCHGVLYKQLSAWMLHGLLQDDREEFFIELHQREEKVSCSLLEDVRHLMIFYDRMEVRRR